MGTHRYIQYNHSIAIHFTFVDPPLCIHNLIHHSSFSFISSLPLLIYSLLLVFRCTQWSSFLSGINPAPLLSIHRWRFVREAIAFVAQLSSRGGSPGLQPSKCHGTTGYDDRLPGFSLGMAHQVGMSSVSGRWGAGSRKSC